MSVRLLYRGIYRKVYKNNILAKLLNALKTKGVRNEQGVNLQNMSFWR
jgi:hypothetical protein